MQSPPPGDPPNQHAHPGIHLCTALPARPFFPTNLERSKWGSAAGENGQGDAWAYGRECGRLRG
eukprot:14593568-Alexandrium_andersonii.AAC.1